MLSVRTDPDLATVPCTRCGAVGGLRIEVRPELIAMPLGTWSLAGAQMKVNCIEVDWPWMVCDHCKAESRGRYY